MAMIPLFSYPKVNLFHPDDEIDQKLFEIFLKKNIEITAFFRSFPSRNIIIRNGLHIKSR